MVGFSWDAIVDLVRVWPDFQRTQERMTMRNAVGCWLMLPASAQRCVSIRPVESYAVDLNGRKATIAFLSFQAIEELAKRADFFRS